MKNKIIGGLVGILIGLGVNSHAMEVNKEGFEVPNKTKSILTNSILEYENDKGNVVVNVYRGELNFNEVLTNNKPVIYVILDKRGYSKYMIADEDCNGKFKTKCSIEEGTSKFGEILENVPIC